MIAPVRSSPPQQPRLLRAALGGAIRDERIAQERSLRSVASQARVSLGYLSEVERGRKEASSELLAAICDALAIPQSLLVGRAAAALATGEAQLATAAAPTARVRSAA